MSFAQLPQCDRIYIDQFDLSTFTQTQKIYTYNPALPVSATNPALNTIQLPSINADGLTVSEVLGSGNTTLTFYTVVNDKYWYYNPTTSAWVNTNHITGGNGIAVNIASGGGYIFNLDGINGDIYRYDGTGSGTFLVNVPDFEGDGPFDLIADCAGNFYLLNATGFSTAPFLRKYNSNGVLVQSWTINNPNNYSPSAGFGILGTQIYIDDFGGIFNGIVSGSINASTADLTNLAGPFAAYNGQLMAGDLGSCASGVPVSPVITITASATSVGVGVPVTFTSTINAGGTNPQYQWYVNGVAVPGETNSTFTYMPTDGDVITCMLTSNLGCITTPTALSNAITINVDGCDRPTLVYTPSDLCLGQGIAIPAFAPPGGTFSAAPAGLPLNANSGDIDLSSSNAGTYVIKYSRPATDICPAASVQDTVTIYPVPPARISIDNFGDKLCLNEKVTLRANEHDGYIYQWFPAKFFQGVTSGSTVIAKATADEFMHLSITSAQGCTNEDSVLLKPVPCCIVTIPSAFTPNGDGMNDIFKVNSIADQKLNQFYVYNRFGELVFSAIDQSMGWDGTFHDKPCDVGVYYYYVSYTCANGKEIIKKGNVSLIR